MKKFLLDIRGYENVEDIHDYIAMVMDFPYYYGKNLDALYDMLTDITEYTSILFIYEADSMSDFAVKLVDVFEEAEEYNDKLAVFIFVAE